MYEPIAELTRASLLIIGALFPIVDAPDNIPIFLTLTTGLSAESRAVLARKIAVNSFALLIVSVLIGTHILAFFGVSLPVVPVGGGLIVTSVGWRSGCKPNARRRARCERTSVHDLRRSALGSVPDLTLAKFQRILDPPLFGS